MRKKGDERFVSSVIMVGPYFLGWCGSAENDVIPFTLFSQVRRNINTIHNSLVTQDTTRLLASPVHTTDTKKHNTAQSKKKNK